jgi:hypothetical protein
MRDQQVLLQNYQVAPETLWIALKRALTTLDGVTLDQANDAQKTASFKTGVTWTSWGQNMIATIELLESEEARLHIMGQVRHTFLSSDWGEDLHSSGFVHGLTNLLDRSLAEVLLETNVERRIF